MRLVSISVTSLLYVSHITDCSPCYVCDNATQESAVKGVLEEKGGDYDSVSTDSGNSEGEGERGDGSLGESDSIPSMDDAVRRNSSPTVGEHGTLPTCKIEGDGLCPPSPPPRPQHTLSQDSFSVDNDKVGPLTSRGIPSPGRGSPTKSRGMPSGNGTHSSGLNPKKASWRKPKRRPAVSSCCKICYLV